MGGSFQNGWKSLKKSGILIPLDSCVSIFALHKKRAYIQKITVGKIGECHGPSCDSVQTIPL
jgi:hypothetical protein